MSRAELEKWGENAGKWETITAFFAWLEDEGYYVDIESDDGTVKLDELHPDALAYKFLEIDPAKLDEERRQLLEEQRKANAGQAK